MSIPARLEPVRVYTVPYHLDYITNSVAKEAAQQLLDELRHWDVNNISIEPIKYYISIKVSGKVFAYLESQRKRLLVWTYDSGGEWTSFPVQQTEDLHEVKPLLRSNYEKFKKGV